MITRNTLVSTAKRSTKKQITPRRNEINLSTALEHGISSINGLRVINCIRSQQLNFLNSIKLSIQLWLSCYAESTLLQLQTDAVRISGALYCIIFLWFLALSSLVSITRVHGRAWASTRLPIFQRKVLYNSSVLSNIFNPLHSRRLSVGGRL